MLQLTAILREISEINNSFTIYKFTNCVYDFFQCEHNEDEQRSEVKSRSSTMVKSHMRFLHCIYHILLNT